jgi:hypothetical protein
VAFLSDRTCAACGHVFEALALSREEHDTESFPCTKCGEPSVRRVGSVAPPPADSVVKRALTEEQADMAVTRQRHHMRRGARLGGV